MDGDSNRESRRSLFLFIRERFNSQTMRAIAGKATKSRLPFGLKLPSEVPRGFVLGPPVTYTQKDIDELLTLPWSIDLWQAQNIYFDIRQQIMPAKLVAAKKNDPATAKWLQQFEALGGIMGISL